jgi:site-specific DNA recombinase
MTNAAIYARISQNDVKVPAIENQIKNLEALAEAEGYTIVHVYSDDGISAWSGKKRPGFLDLIRGIKNHEFEVILAVAEDRLTRSSEEKIGLQSDSVKAGVTWHTLASGKVDPSTAEGGLLATITGALSQYESTLKKERLDRSVADRLALGKDLGGPRPFGFEKDRKTIREPEAAVLRAGYEMIMNDAKGRVWAVAKLFTDSGIKRDRGKDGAWRTQTVRSILLRERNVGRLVVKGVTYSDEYPAIIDVETFDKVKAILTNENRKPRRGPKPMQWAAIGSVRCGVCGNHMSQTGQRKKDGKRHLRCSPQGRTPQPEGVRHPTVEVEKLDLELSTIVQSQVRQYGLRNETFDSPANSITPLRLKVAELVRQRDVVQGLATIPGANLTKVHKDLSELGKQIDEAQAQLDAAMSSDTATAAIEAAMDSMGKVKMIDGKVWVDMSAWYSYWRSIDIETKRTLITALAPDLLLMPSGIGQRDFRLNFDFETGQAIKPLRPFII